MLLKSWWYIITFVKIFFGGINMKKLLAVLMAVLVAFSALSVVVMADETAGAETVVENNKNIMNDDGLVFPENFTQLEYSIIFKLFEKALTYIFDLIESIFGDILPELDVDDTLAGGVEDLDGIISDRIEQVVPQA